MPGLLELGLIVALELGLTAVLELTPALELALMVGLGTGMPG